MLMFFSNISQAFILSLNAIKYFLKTWNDYFSHRILMLIDSKGTGPLDQTGRRTNTAMHPYRRWLWSLSEAFAHVDLLTGGYRPIILKAVTKSILKLNYFELNLNASEFTGNGENKDVARSESALWQIFGVSTTGPDQYSSELVFLKDF